MSALLMPISYCLTYAFNLAFCYESISFWTIKFCMRLDRKQFWNLSDLAQKKPVESFLMLEFVADRIKFLGGFPQRYESKSL
jgi:hypothetical protein